MVIRNVPLVSITAPEAQCRMPNDECRKGGPSRRPSVRHASVVIPQCFASRRDRPAVIDKVNARSGDMTMFDSMSQAEKSRIAAPWMLDGAKCLGRVPVRHPASPKPEGRRWLRMEDGRWRQRRGQRPAPSAIRRQGPPNPLLFNPQSEIPNPQSKQPRLLAVALTPRR